VPQVSVRRICRVLGVSRSAVASENISSEATPIRRPLNSFLVERIRGLISETSHLRIPSPMGRAALPRRPRHTQEDGLPHPYVSIDYFEL
jgi:hypothetical protein